MNSTARNNTDSPYLAEKITEYKRRNLIQNVMSALELAEMRCLPTKELLAKIPSIHTNKNKEVIIHCLQEKSLSRKDKATLWLMLKQLSIEGDKLPSREKPRVDRIILRLAKLLPKNLANDLIKILLHSKRKARREAAYRLILFTGIRQRMAKHLMQLYQQNHEQDYLKLIAQSSKAVLTLEDDIEFLLENLEERYWRMRVFEILIQHRPERASELASEYTYEFTYAVGQCKETSHLETLRVIFEANKKDLEFIPVYAWALGKIGARDDLKRLNEFVRKNNKSFLLYPSPTESPRGKDTGKDIKRGGKAQNSKQGVYRGLTSTGRGKTKPQLTP